MRGQQKRLEPHARNGYGAEIVWNQVRWLAVWGVLFGCAPRALAEPATPASRPRIVFFSPNSEANTYWPQVFRIIEKVARDLEFEFVPYSLGVEDRFERQQKVLRILQAEPRPQAVIASVVIGHSQRILDASEALDIPVFILGPLFPSELPGVGMTPRRKYKTWAAVFNWAEEQKGYALGTVLLAAAQKRGAYAPDGSIHVVGVGGDPTWFGSDLRQAGLTRAVAEQPRAVLEQVVPTRWKREEAHQLTLKLLRRFPDASVVWAASDQLGVGVVDALTQLGRVPGQTAFTGGLDLSEVGLQRVREGSFVATAATTLLSFAQAAVLIYDYVSGLDFAPELGSQLEFPTEVATRDNVAQHLRLLRCVDNIDFKRFSKVHNKLLQRYDFSMAAYLDAAGACVRH